MPTRAEPSTLDEVYSFDGWSVFPPRGVLSRAGAEVHLAPPPSSGPSTATRGFSTCSPGASPAAGAEPRHLLGVARFRLRNRVP